MQHSKNAPTSVQPLDNTSNSLQSVNINTNSLYTYRIKQHGRDKLAVFCSTSTFSDAGQPRRGDGRTTSPSSRRRSSPVSASRRHMTRACRRAGTIASGGFRWRLSPLSAPPPYVRAATTQCRWAAQLLGRAQLPGGARRAPRACR